MFIASKYEEMYAPEIGDFVYITDRAYTEPQIREMEMKILSTLSKKLFTLILFLVHITWQIFSLSTNFSN